MKHDCCHRTPTLNKQHLKKRKKMRERIKTLKNSLSFNPAVTVPFIIDSQSMN